MMWSVYLIFNGNEQRLFVSILSLEAESVAEAGQGVVSGTAVVGPQVTHGRDASS